MYNYTEKCDKKHLCNATKGLICPSNTNTCNCPVISSSIFCDCKTDSYWDYDEDKCGKLELFLIIK